VLELVKVTIWPAGPAGLTRLTMPVTFVVALPFTDPGLMVTAATPGTAIVRLA